MKKILVILLTLLFSLPVYTYAAEEKYIILEPLPYSTHQLGEKLVIRGKTNLPHVVVSLNYPMKDYNGISKDFVSATARELANGVSFPTNKASVSWPEGEWSVVAGSGDVKAVMPVIMSSAAPFDRKIIAACYNDDILTDITAYPCRGISVKNNVIEFKLEDGCNVKIFSWNNFAPTANGNARIVIASFKDGYLTDTKTYQGTLSTSDYSFSLNISENQRFKIFYRDDLLNPLQFN